MLARCNKPVPSIPTSASCASMQGAPLSLSSFRYCFSQGAGAARSRVPRRHLLHANWSRKQARALAKSEATARGSLENIPPPSKHLYINVHSTDAWQNPFLTVHHDTLTLRIIFPQQTSSALDAGTLLHPAAARRQVLEIRMSDLPEALAAVPDFPGLTVASWQSRSRPPRRDRTGRRFAAMWRRQSAS